MPKFNLELFKTLILKFQTFIPNEEVISRLIELKPSWPPLDQSVMTPKQFKSFEYLQDFAPDKSNIDHKMQRIEKNTKRNILKLNIFYLVEKMTRLKWKRFSCRL